ncbi:ABC transporter ATP-binding protein [Actinosynnema sp. NPDC047251]|uniref:ABC-type transporter, ATPase subunit n=1 Tax=Saccharothrix espanaensis (strain ATCC 51144 / DSM 44229 / JCM 9112 / NBRC 15066 / NRRL 15764) TaxID=1179773 RepID=K0JWY3_SACES|nr:ABC transporter ATP-binding protein [Saccharothrix espanaensis]CCH29922.1 ABC-type transporter, ATPase subunit [Saccharothrix espanaensis DSM 44229]
MRNPVIDVTALHCRYGEFEAVRGVDLQVTQGELFALLGTNGAGKTTLVETLEGLRAPSAGRVRVLGVDPGRDRAAIRARTGIMLQQSGFPADLTVAEMVRLWGRGRRGDALERLDLGHRRDVRIKQLSGGERRRLDLVLAVQGEPELLFLDEPTTGLDPESRQRTWDVVRELLARGTTVVLTTHYLEEAESLAHRLAILHQGRVAVTGALVDVLAAQPSRISFDLPHPFDVGALPMLSGDVVHVPSGRVDVRTRQLQDDLDVLLAWARREGLALGRLRAHHASLEDVFHATRQVTAA